MRADDRITEANMLLGSTLLKETLEALIATALTEMLRATDPGELMRKRDFVNAMSAVRPTLEGILREAEAQKRSDATSDAA